MSEEFFSIPEVIPVFPLPGVVLFPGALLPLHVFEPRYRDMARDSLEDHRVIGMALLKPGFEPHYYTLRAPIHEVVGLGQIVAAEKVDDGNYNILIKGVGRARIVEEIPGRPYRQARIEPLVSFSTETEESLDELRGRLREAVQRGTFVDAEVQERLLELFGAPLELGELADLVASGVAVEAELQQFLLEEPEATVRTRMLVEQMRTQTAVANAKRRSQSRPGDHLN